MERRDDGWTAVIDAGGWRFEVHASPSPEEKRIEGVTVYVVPGDVRNEDARGAGVRATVRDIAIALGATAFDDGGSSL